MKIDLAMPPVKRLSIDHEPTRLDAQGNTLLAEIPGATDCIVSGASQRASPGVGARIARKIRAKHGIHTIGCTSVRFMEAVP